MKSILGTPPHTKTHHLGLIKLQGGIQRPSTQDTATGAFTGLFSTCSLFCHHSWRVIFYWWKHTGTQDKIHPFSELSFNHPSEWKIRQKNKTGTCLPMFSLELRRDWHSFCGGGKQNEDRPADYIWDTAASSEGIQQRNPRPGSQPVSSHTCTALCKDTNSGTKNTLHTVAQGYICAKKVLSVPFHYEVPEAAST